MIDEVNMLETSEVEGDVHRVSLIKKILSNLSQITSYGYVVFALLLFLGVLLMVLSQNYSILSTLQAIHLSFLKKMVSLPFSFEDSTMVETLMINCQYIIKIFDHKLGLKVTHENTLDVLR